MRIHIEQKVKEDEEGLDSTHPDYQAWQEGAIKAYQVTTSAICLETGRKADEALFGIAVADGGDDYLKTIKADQIKAVLGELGYDLDF